MSVMTLPADLYRELLKDAYLRYRKHMSRAEAMQRAQAVMDSCARCDEDVAAMEFQRDFDEDNEGTYEGVFR